MELIFGYDVMTYNGEQPILKFNLRQKQVGSNKWKRDKPIMVIQTNGGPLNEQPYPYSWTRDIPYPIAKQLAEYYSKTHHVIQICRHEINLIPGVESVKETMPNMELFYLLLMSEKRILIDSCLQHASAALGLPSTVLWVGTTPDVFGYSLHKNIQAKIPSDTKLPDSYLFDYNFHGDLVECPIFENDVLFNFDEIIQNIDNL
jgi:hypothetical protein